MQWALGVYRGSACTFCGGYQWLFQRHDGLRMTLCPNCQLNEILTFLKRTISPIDGTADANALRDADAELLRKMGICH